MTTLSDNFQARRWPKAESLENFFGKVEINRDGEPSDRWEARSLQRFGVSFSLRMLCRPDTSIQAFRCHRQVTHSLHRVFGAIARIPAEERRAKGIDLFGGCYLPLHTIGNSLSLHAYGAAVRLGEGKDAVKAIEGFFEAEGWKKLSDKSGNFLALA